MRQAGILAAGALHALEHHRARLQQDHDNARAIASVLATVPGVIVDLQRVETNMVMVDSPGIPADTIAARSREQGVLVAVFGPERIRIVTHLDVADTALEGAQRLARVLASLTGARS